MHIIGKYPGLDSTDIRKQKSRNKWITKRTKPQNMGIKEGQLVVKR